MGVCSADDAILLRSYALEGDARAFAELVQRYAGLVYSTARRITGSADAAEDVAQDCFLRLAQKSAAITGSVAAWLHRTCVNRSLEIIRCERSRRQREANAPPRSTNSDDPSELISRVDEALASLPEDLRCVVTEHFLCGKSQVELAAVFGVNQSTISRRIDHGIAQLRQKLHDEGWTAAPLALPLLLQQAFTTATAPTGVCSALTKIGLSGVGGAAGAKAGVSLALRIIFAVALCGSVVAAGIAVRTYVVSIRNPRPPAATTPAVKEVEIKFDQVPQRVRQTMLAQSNGSKIDAVDKETADGKIVYSGDVVINGKTWEIRVAEDGRFISKLPSTE